MVTVVKHVQQEMEILKYLRMSSVDENVLNKQNIRHASDVCHV